MSYHFSFFFKLIYSCLEPFYFFYGLWECDSGRNKNSEIMLRQYLVLLEDNLLASNHKNIKNQNREYIAQIITIFSLRNIGKSLSFNPIWTRYIFYTLHVFFFPCSIYPNALMNVCWKNEWLLIHNKLRQRWGDNGNSDRLYFLGLQSHCRLWLQPWN